MIVNLVFGGESKHKVTEVANDLGRVAFRVLQTLADTFGRLPIERRLRGLGFITPSVSR